MGGCGHGFFCRRVRIHPTEKPRTEGQTQPRPRLYIGRTFPANAAAEESRALSGIMPDRVPKKSNRAAARVNRVVQK